MIELLYALGIMCLFLGSFCNIIAGIGIFYFRDLYSRMHATGITDSLGTGLILTGLMLLNGWGSVSGKLFLILLFTLITSPTVSYILANTAMKNNSKNNIDGGIASKKVGRVDLSNR